MAGDYGAQGVKAPRNAAPVGGAAALPAPKVRIGEQVGMRRKGFTLIELLVVVAIIVILAGILFPVFAASKRAATNAVCLSNLKQIGLATSLYTQDYDEAFPVACCQTDRIIGKAQFSNQYDLSGHLVPVPYLWQVVTPYVKNATIWRCPGDTGFTLNHGAIRIQPSAFQEYGSSYNYNTDLVWDEPDNDPYFQAVTPGVLGQWAPMTVGSIQHPDETFISAEPTGYWHNGILGTTNSYHQNTVCVDGHAKSFTRALLQALGNRTRDQF
jgi:prepilin-type N-terminal cleavage/methylation domain-containing protein